MYARRWNCDDPEFGACLCGGLDGCHAQVERHDHPRWREMKLKGPPPGEDHA